MKKIITMILCCLFTATTAIYAQSDEKIFLQHNGAITNIFDRDGISTAIESAAEGDTLFFSTGSFYGNFTINKSISLIGVNASDNNNSNRTYFEYSGDDIRIETTDNQTLNSVYFEGIQFANSMNFYSTVNNITIKKCYFNNGINFWKYNKKVIIDRCRVNSIYMSGQIEDLTVKNCKISNPYGTGGLNVSSCKYINCNIRNVDTETKAMFINSIINSVGDGINSYLSSQSMLVNTLYHNMNGYDPMQNCSQQDCWSSTETLIDEYGNYDCTLTADQLKEAGYLGTDGTVVGCEGGVNPFTLERHIPIITQKGTKVDLDNKKVIINVNVTAK